MKIILITGSTDGIGKLTAIKFANDGHQVLLHGRNEEKLQQTIQDIKARTKNERIFGFVSDLSDFQSIHRMVAEIMKDHSKIDVVINNAGVYNSSVHQNENNLDMRFAVNYFAPVLLTNGLMQLLKKSTSPQVINLSSAAQATVSVDVLNGIDKVSDQSAYAQSKLALTIWSFYFAKKHPEINTIAVNPGSLLDTKMVKEAFGQHWGSADKGASILYDLVVEKEYDDSSGKYFDNDRGSFSKAHSDAYDQTIMTTLMSETEKILKSNGSF